MKENIRAKLLGLCRRLEELDAMLAAPDAADDMKRFTELSRERAEIEPVVLKTKEYEQTLEDIATAEEMAKDPEVAEFAREEMLAGKKKLEELEQDLQILLLPRDPDDNKNTFLEIRAGTGGEESALFAGDLLRMYMRYAERKGFKVTLEEESAGDVAGIKSATLFIEGEWAYGTLRTETGIHRLVRKSPFDANARRHTSFTSVYVYPEVDDSIEIEINPADLKIDVFRASGAGGQHIQKTESAVRIHHVPSGIITICQDDRSQHRNREKAMQQLKAKLYELEMRKRMEEQTKLEESKSDIGWGHQIRSYVLDQSRVKDLRTNVETGNTGAVLDGDLDQFIEASLKMGI